MRASHLTGAMVPRGRIVAWVPTRATLDQVSSAPRDRRPLTADQAAHIAASLTAEPGVPELAPWIGVTCSLPGATPQSVAHMLSAFFDRHESLRSVISRPAPNNRPRRRQLPVGAVAFEPRPLGVADRPGDGYDLVANHLADEARCDEWPYAGFVTVEGEQGTTLFAAFDHITFDGYSVFIALDDLLRFHEGADADGPAGSHVDFAEQESHLVRALDPSDAPLRAWAAALGESGRLPGPPPATGVSSCEQLPHQLVSIPLTDAATAQRYADLCKRHRFAPGVGFLGAFAHAAIEQDPGRPLDLLLCTHNRTQPDWQRSVGWFAGVAPLSVGPAEGAATTSLLDTIARTTSAWVGAQAAGAIRIPEATRRLGGDVEPGLVLSYLDGRRTPGWERWAAIGARILLGHVAPSGQLHLWINLMPDGLYLEARHPGLPVTTQWVEAVAERMRELISSPPLPAEPASPTTSTTVTSA